MSSDLFALQSDIDLQDEAKRILDLPDAVLIEAAWRFLAKLPARLDSSLGSPMRLAIRGAHGRIEAKERLAETMATRMALIATGTKRIADAASQTGHKEKTR